MKKFEYRHIPSLHSVYKVQEGHGYQQIVYEGPQIGVTGRLHSYNEEFEAALLCYCHPSKDIVPISAATYQFYLEQVNDMRRGLAA